MSKKRALGEIQEEVEQQIPGHLFKPVTQKDKEKKTNEIKATILEQRKKDEAVNKKEEDLLIGMLGRITQYKGHEDLINALSTLEKKYLDKVKVIFVGDGEKSEIKRLKKILNELNLAHKVFFVG